MFELTGELDYMVPHMIAILSILLHLVFLLMVASKWVSDYLQPHFVYSLSQVLLNHPFYDYNEPPKMLFSHTLSELILSSHTMKESPFMWITIKSNYRYFENDLHFFIEEILQMLNS